MNLNMRSFRLSHDVATSRLLRNHLLIDSKFFWKSYQIICYLFSISLKVKNYEAGYQVFVFFIKFLFISYQKCFKRNWIISATFLHEYITSRFENTSENVLLLVCYLVSFRMDFWIIKLRHTYNAHIIIENDKAKRY